MKNTYEITITADVTMSHTFRLRAHNEYDARAQAYSMAEANGLLGFELDEGNPVEFYDNGVEMTGPDE